MIISREYVSFWQLINRDPDAKDIFMKSFDDSYSDMDVERREEWFCLLTQQCLYQREMGWCFNGIGDVIDGFRRLDEEKPYDNGFTYEDVKRVDIWNWDPDGLTLALINIFDGIEQIVEIVRIGKSEKVSDDVAAACIIAETFGYYKTASDLECWRNFPETMRTLGFEMDCGKSFREYQDTCGLTVKPATNDREEKRNTLYLLEHADRQTIGNYLFSQWRYLTHWSYGYTEYDVDFLKRVLTLLESKYPKVKQRDVDN